MAGSWYKGTLHQHTGFSTWNGYDNVDNSSSDECDTPLEGHERFAKKNDGRNVSTLIDVAKSLGHSFVAITDHTYCLDKDEFEIIKKDCKTDPSFVCLPGEEVSTTDTENDFEYLACERGESIKAADTGEAHIGTIGIKDYIPQDPFASHCPKGPDPQKVITKTNNQGGVAILNHPLDVNLLDLKSINDISGETGIEVWNGNLPRPRSLPLWVRSRLFGDIRNSWVFTGTDSHDDVYSDPYQYVYLESLDNESLKKGLKSGRHVASNNGYIDFTIRGAVMGQTVRVTYGEQINLNISWNVSNSCKLDVIMGDFASKREYIVKTFPSVSGNGSDTHSETVDTPRYYRLECIGGTKRIFSNPIWVDPKHNITINNTGKADLIINSITDDKPWLSTSPTVRKLNPIKPGGSKDVEIIIDYSKLKKTINIGLVTIKSNSPDNSEINVTVIADKYARLGTRFSSKGLIQSSWQSKLIIEPNETENLELVLDWATGDELNVTLTAPNGSNYTASGHPKIINISNPMNGTWIVNVSGNDSLKGLEFGTETDTKPSDVPPTSINFTDVRIGYVNACEDYRRGLRVVMDGIESKAGDVEGPSISVIPEEPIIICHTISNKEQNKKEKW